MLLLIHDIESFHSPHKDGFSQRMCEHLLSKSVLLDVELLCMACLCGMDDTAYPCQDMGSRYLLADRALPLSPTHKFMYIMGGYGRVQR